MTFTGKSPLLLAIEADESKAKRKLTEVMIRYGWILANVARELKVSRDTVRRMCIRAGLGEELERHGRLGKAAATDAKIEAFYQALSEKDRTYFNRVYRAKRARGEHHARSRGEAMRLTTKKIDKERNNG